MFSLLYYKTPHSLSSILRNFRDLRILECSSVIITRSLSSTISCQKQVKETSFTLSYLINSCGLSPEVANIVSKKVKFETLDRPDSVLALLKKHGFDDSHIAGIVKKQPRVLLADPEKTILSKIEFFCSIGITGTNLADIVSRNPSLLWTSLSNRIIPLYKLLKSTLPFGDDIIIKAMSNASKNFVREEARIRVNIEFTREVGMSESVIQLLVLYNFHLLCYKGDIFRKKIKETIDMGFCPTLTKFLQALAAVASMSESTWRHKMEVYVRCGWSKDDIMSAFKVDPRCMLVSEKKIVNIMDFLVNVMDMKPSVIATTPYILIYNLEKRIIPRGLVVKMLMMKGLLVKDISFPCVVKKTEKWFLEWYLEKPKKHVPYLMDVFEGKMFPQELEFLSKYIHCPKNVDI